MPEHVRNGFIEPILNVGFILFVDAEMCLSKTSAAFNATSLGQSISFTNLLATALLDLSCAIKQICG